MQKRLFFDIETTSNPESLALMPDPQPPAYLKDPQKIADAIQEKKAELIEKAALDPDYGRILSLGYSTGGEIAVILNSEIFGSGKTEKEILAEFWEVFRDCGGACVGYNILAFDLPYLMRRSMALNVKPPFPPNLAKYRTEPVTDLMAILYNWGSDKYKSLKQVARLYGIENETEGTDGSMVANLSASDLYKYQTSDVKLVMELYSKMNGIYFNHR